MSAGTTSSRYRWNAGAVWASGEEPYGGLWDLLIYPPGHPLAGREMHLAFHLRTGPGSGVPAETPAPGDFGLYENVPNPFTGSTTLRFRLPAAGGRAKLDVFDVRGRRIVRLVDAIRHGGTHTATWNGRDSAGNELPAGIYFQRLTLGDQSTARKMLLIR